MYFSELISKTYGRGDTFTTKDFAELCNITTKEAYNILCKLEKEGFNICKYGYWVKKGRYWEDVEQSKLRPNSLSWQVSQF